MSIKLKHAFRCLLLALILLCDLCAAQTTHARKGFLDLRTWNFEEGIVNLTGEWEFYMSQLVDPRQFTTGNKIQQEYIDFPSAWNEFSKSLNPGEGYATYRLKLFVTSPQSLAFELPHFYSNYSLWINSRLITFNGKVGNSEKTSVPEWRPQTVDIVAYSDTLDIVIHVSNFHHAKGGVREPILLGNSDHLNLKKQIALGSSAVMFSILLILTVAFGFLFFFSKKEKSIIYFALLCLTWGIRSLFSNQYAALNFIQDIPWELVVKIEYTSLHLTMVWAILFLASLFKNEVNLTFKYLFCICNMVFVAITVFFKANLYTQFLPVYLSFAVLLLIYIIFVLIRAVAFEREGVWLMVGGLFLGVILFSYDLIAYQGIATFNPIILNVGYIAVFILLGITLLLQTGHVKPPGANGNVLTYEEMFGSAKKPER